MRTDLQSQLMTKANTYYSAQIPADKKTTTQPSLAGSDVMIKNGSSQVIQKNNPAINSTTQGNDMVVKQDAYVPSDPNPKKAGYDKPTVKPDVVAVNRLKEESNRIYNSMKEAVKQMLEKQGMTFQDVATNVSGSVSGNNQSTALEGTAKTSQEEAVALISEGGALSPEKLSDTILEFAKAISGEDKSKLQILRNAIDEGFNEAKQALGGELPEISKQTYDLVQQKLDAWEKGSTETPASNNVKSGNGVLSNGKNT